MKRQTKGFLFITLSASSYAISPIIIKYIINKNYDILFAGSAAMLIGALFYWALVLNKSENFLFFSKDMMLLILFAALVFLMNIYALEITDVSTYTMVFYSYPIFVTIGGCIFNKHSLSKKKWLTLAVSMLGLFLTLGATGYKLNSTPFVFLILIASAVTYSAYSICLERLSKEHNSIVIIMYQLSAVSVISFVLYFSKSGITANITFEAAFLVLIYSLCNYILPLFFLVDSLKYINIITATLVSLFEPVLTIIVACIMFHEKISCLQILGFILVIFGSWLIYRDEKD